MDNKLDLITPFSSSDDVTTTPHGHASFAAQWTCTHPDGSSHTITRIVELLAPTVPGRYFVELYPFVDNFITPTEERSAPPARWMLLVSTVTQ